MKKCELERVVREKGNPKLRRTGEKLTSIIEGICNVSEGSVIELKKQSGLWVVDKIHEQNIILHKLNKNWSVSSM